MKQRLLTAVIMFFLAAFSLAIYLQDSFAQLTGGTTYPVNGVQSPPASFENITAAVAYLTANGVTGSGEVILELNAGIIDEPGPVTIGPVSGAGSSLGITFRPASGYTANTLIAGAGSPNQNAINLAGCSYITIDGRSGGTGSSRNWTIKVGGSGTAGNGHMAIRINGVAGNMTGITIRNLVLIGEAANTTNAVLFITGNTANTVSNVIVEDNLVTSTATASTNTRAFGISTASLNNAGNTGIIIRNNEITNVYGRGISITGACPGLEVYNNEIYHTASITQPAVTEFSGIYFSSTLTNANGNKIYNNRIYNIRLTNGTTAVNGFYSIGSPGTGERLSIYNNMISIGSELTGTAADLAVYGIRENSTSTAQLNIFYNSVYVGGIAASGANVSSAFRKQSSNNINLKNNIFYNTRSNSGGTGTHYAIMINNINATSRNYNDYYVSGTGGVLGTTTGLAAGNQATLDDWKTASGRDTNSISKVIFFEDAAAGDLNLTGDSNGDLDLRGTPVAGITTDIDGHSRNEVYPYMGADEAPIPLPVELLSFTASIEKRDVYLNWVTSGEINNSGFDIERSSTTGGVKDETSNEWSKIAFIDGSGTTNEAKDYLYIDKGLNAGKYNYRLRQIDYNGNFEYFNLSNEIIIGVPGKYDLSQNYPNPFNPVTKINFEIPVEGLTKLLIYDLAGREVASLVNEVKTPGYYTVDFNGASLSSGVYFYRLVTSNAVITKKMMLVK